MNSRISQSAEPNMSVCNPSANKPAPRWQFALACSLAMGAWMATASISEAALASYVFFTEGSSSYLAKFDGSSMTVISSGLFGGSQLGSNQNSSGGGLSLLQDGGGIYVVNPGTAGGGTADVTLTQITLNATWNTNPVGRHGSPGSDQPSAGIFRGTITGGVTSTPNINSPSPPLSGQAKSAGGVEMGDFAHDLFSGATTGHTYIAAQSSDSLIDLGAFSAPKSVQAAGGAIIEKSTGGVFFVDPAGTMTQLINPNTLAAFASMNNNTGGKVGGKGIFNADGSSWFYDPGTNIVSNWSGGQISGFVRIGDSAWIQDSSGVYFWDGIGGVSQIDSAQTVTGGLSFGDYALITRTDGTTGYARDNGASYDYALWSGSAYDLTRATGGYLGVINEVPEPSSLTLLLVGSVGLLGRYRRARRNRAC